MCEGNGLSLDKQTHHGDAPDKHWQILIRCCMGRWKKKRKCLVFSRVLHTDNILDALNFVDTGSAGSCNRARTVCVKTSDVTFLHRLSSLAEGEVLLSPVRVRPSKDLADLIPWRARWCATNYRLQATMLKTMTTRVGGLKIDQLRCLISLNG